MLTDESGNRHGLNSRDADGHLGFVCDKAMAYHPLIMPMESSIGERRIIYPEFDEVACKHRFIARNDLQRLIRTPPIFGFDGCHEGVARAE